LAQALVPPDTGVRMNEIKRREFLAKTASATALLPLIPSARPETDRPRVGQARKTAIKRIAVEEHWTSEDVREANQGPKSAFSDRQADLGEVRLAEMDSAGITMQVIANSSYQAIADTSKAVYLAKKNNDYLAEMIQRHPRRFAGFAALPTQDPKAAAEELERTVKQLGFKGAMVEGQDHANWEYLDSKKFWGLWERAAGLGVPIYMHPNIPSLDSFKLVEGYTELQTLMWAGGVYTATQALRLMCSGVFDAFPNAVIMLGHLGELLPYWLGRLDGISRQWKVKKTPSQYIRENVLVTTSGHYRPEALLCAIAAMGVDRVLFATDYAAVDGKVAVEIFEKVPMSDGDREKIYHLNAERWLRL
jgi:2,3-dihydroxybenzoate decarboxylase